MFLHHHHNYLLFDQLMKWYEVLEETGNRMSIM